MNKIHQIIKSFLVDYNLNNPDLVYLVAFSGGYDSMCLLDSLKKVCPDNKIIALHLNHNWRGEESDSEEQNCADFCKKIGVEFYSEKLSSDVPKNETAARDARYEFFYKCAKKYNSNIIFTAHNKNDNAETLIFRICHGTGVNGLRGISPKRDIFYRPILGIERKDIEDYCRINNLSPNYDSSNDDNIHKRNLIRSEILPLIKKELNENILEALNSLSVVAAEETEIVKEYISKIREKICFEKSKYKTKDFLQLSESVQKRVIYEIMTPLIPENYDRERLLILWNFIKDNCNLKSGKTISVTKGYLLFVNDKFFEIISDNVKEEVSINIKSAGEYRYGGFSFNIFECNSNTDKCAGISGGSVFVDLSDVDFDFVLRTRQDGDIIQPFGMSGHQKLKKYLNAKKIPNHQKDKLLFLAQGKEILWSEIGMSEKIRVKTRPTHVIIIKKEGI
ncbi:tRNA lysidine(34) synthetase TilS [bacterium]|nr:tRNA lysidine(34) synthetase TilS [bacterium]